MCVIAYSTAWGPVVFSDSSGYIEAARNLLAGDGLGTFKPNGALQLLTSHPPLYPLGLAALGWLGMDLVEGNRWLNAILFGSLIGVSGWSLFNLTRSFLIALPGSLIFLISPLLVNIYSMAMSEAIFLFAALAGIYLLLIDQQKPKTWQVALAGLFTAIACLTRYIGIASIVAGAGGLLILSPVPLRRRVRDAMLYTLIGCLPLLIWLSWIALQPTEEAPRLFQAPVSIWQALAPARLALSDQLWSWIPFFTLLPTITYRVKLGFFILIGFTILLLVCWATWKTYKFNLNKWLDTPGMRPVALLTLLFFTYLGVILLSYLFAVPTLDLNERTLLPIFMLLILMDMALIDFFSHAWQRQKWIYWIALAGLLLYATAFIPSTWAMAAKYHREGDGYTGKHWRESATIQALRQLPKDQPIVTNEPAAVSFLTGRVSYTLEESIQTEPLAEFSRYGEDLSDPAQKVFRQDGAVLVLFDTIRWQLDKLYFEKTPERLAALTDGLVQVGDFWDGALYLYQEEK